MSSPFYIIISGILVDAFRTEGSKSSLYKANVAKELDYIDTNYIQGVFASNANKYGLRPILIKSRCDASTVQVADLNTPVRPDRRI